MDFDGLKALNNRTYKADYLEGLNIGEGYLVITTNPLLGAANKFTDWKRMLGYDITLESRAYWTADQIFGKIKDWYDENRNAKYLLLLGDSIAIPEKAAHYNGKYDIEAYSDLYYVCLDGEDDYTPDLIFGRIPATTLAQANNVIEKIIAYEKKPNGDQFAGTGKRRYHKCRYAMAR